MDRSQQSVGFLIADREIDLDRHVAGEFEKMLLVQHAVAAEPRDRAKGRPSMDAGLLRMLEQPFVEQDVMMLATFVNVEAQQRSIHGHLHWNSARAATRPTSVIAIEPTTCAPTPTTLHNHSRRRISVVISPENVEKVVSPPRNPVVSSRRASGDSSM